MRSSTVTTPPPAPDALLHKLRSIDLSAQPVAQPLPSPCISVCRMDDARQYCVGCLRTLDELRAWGSADALTQREIWLRIRARCTPPT
ncbi:DUF1289 domain-containing protein [Comamonas sp. NoAH]|uniref:DUF1289 domain-containing protein n=1 Tax=Comamonas halotolerans TaxID=3041496 RepID=UPI0024E05186|nr:DUF1289 domain-containing protein [Comamonas sp. NoAH]